jgi:hypothetical protein
MTLPRITGLLLGAGASYEAGMPLVWDLTSEIRTWLTPAKLRQLNHGWRIQGGGYSDAVIDDCIGVLERDGLHYENILGYLETQFQRQRTAALRTEYYGLYSWLVELVYHLLYYRQVNNSDFFDRHLPFYGGIQALAESNKPLWIFSLNHDVIVESLAARHSIPLYCGFSPTIVTLPRRDSCGNIKGELRAQVLTKDNLEKGAMHFPNPPQQGIYLLKLHGALDIFAFNEGNDILKLLPAEPTERSVIETLRAANEDLIYVLPGSPGGKAKANNQIAYADAQGVMQFLRRSLLAGAYKFDPRATHVLPRSLLRHFGANINFVTNLVAIGYSFGDDHINGIVRRWLEFSAERHIEIVDPRAERIPQSLLHLAPQVTLTQRTATDWLDHKAGIDRKPEEQAYKQTAALLRKQGRERVAAVMQVFAQRESERIQSQFMERLDKLPKRDGKPDFSAIGNPQELAQKWAAEIIGDQRQRLDRVQQFFKDKQSE